MDRGYSWARTSAEVGLIQMNGRLYDPVLRTFLAGHLYTTTENNPKLRQTGMPMC
jgi:hypothetical protein